MEPTAPAAYYLLTFRTYGSWLHGDERGSIDRRRNRPGQALIPAIPEWESYERSLMRAAEMRLDESQRSAVSDGIRQFASQKGWRLFAMNVRTNHLHIVVETSFAPERAMRDLKVAATKELRRRGLVGADQPVWARGGSIRTLASERAREAACKYVVEDQGNQLGEVPEPH